MARIDLSTDDLPKQDGGRAVPPEETLDRVRPHLKHIGVTRLADLTGLDRIGLPVAQAIRPGARALSVRHGKGPTVAAARAGAAMEALETWHAEHLEALPERLRVPEARRRARVACTDHLDDIRMRWVWGWELASDEAALLPFDRVAMAYDTPPDCPGIERTSSGLASGNTRAEAFASALFETIETHAQRSFSALDAAQKEARRVAPKDVGRIALAAEILARDLWLDLWDISGPLGIPAYWAIISETSDRSLTRIGPAKGTGCHLDAETAIYRAISEAAQSRLALISGARDDIGPEDYTIAALAPARRGLSHFARQAPAGADHGTQSATSAFGDVQILVKRLQDYGCRAIFAHDLTRPDIGIPVMRALVPDLWSPRRAG